MIVSALTRASRLLITLDHDRRSPWCEITATAGNTPFKAHLKSEMGSIPGGALDNYLHVPIVARSADASPGSVMWLEPKTTPRGDESERRETWRRHKRHGRGFWDWVAQESMKGLRGKES